MLALGLACAVALLADLVVMNLCKNDPSTVFPGVIVLAVLCVLILACGAAVSHQDSARL